MKNQKKIICFDYTMINEKESEIITGNAKGLTLRNLESSFYPECY